MLSLKWMVSVVSFHLICYMEQNIHIQKYICTVTQQYPNCVLSVPPNDDPVIMPIPKQSPSFDRASARLLFLDRSVTTICDPGQKHTKTHKNTQSCVTELKNSIVIKGSRYFMYDGHYVLIIVSLTWQAMHKHSR